MRDALLYIAAVLLLVFCGWKQADYTPGKGWRPVLLIIGAYVAGLVVATVVPWGG